MQSIRLACHLDLAAVTCVAEEARSRDSPFRAMVFSLLVHIDARGEFIHVVSKYDVEPRYLHASRQIIVSC